MTFRIDYISEPKLMFLNGESINPTVGLLKYSPRFSSEDETKHKWVKVGIIGTSKSISQTINFFEDMRYNILPEKTVKWLMPFPGVNEQSPLKFSFSFRPEWQERFSIEEIKTIEGIETLDGRIEKVLSLVDSKMKVIYEKSPPEVIIVTIPEEIEKLCINQNYDNPLIKLRNEDDFHNRIKVYGMRYKMPTQLIRPKTFALEGTQDKSLIAWNLAVGMLYKSQKGYPWKLTYLPQETCFVGISFYKENLSGKKCTRASMAQVFLDTGQSFILRGDPFECDEKDTKSPHLSKADAKHLIEVVLAQYNEVKGVVPQRLVIHKSSNYLPDEYEGFMDAAKDIRYKDFITIQKSDVKLYRTQSMPILRGSYLSTPDDNEYYLFTTGYVPCLETYPGLSIPFPLMVRVKYKDTPIRQILEEILAFTKLDWNNTFIYRKEPVTLSVSRKVGQILSESEAHNIEIDPHYYFYM